MKTVLAMWRQNALEPLLKPLFGQCQKLFFVCVCVCVCVCMCDCVHVYLCLSTHKQPCAELLVKFTVRKGVRGHIRPRLHLSFECNFYHPITPGPINCQVWTLVPDRILLTL